MAGIIAFADAWLDFVSLFAEGDAGDGRTHGRCHFP